MTTCLGAYTLVAGGAVHGRPVWRHERGDRCSGGSGNSAIGSQHKQQEPIKSAGGLVGSRAKPPRGSKEHTASLQASVPPALEQMSQSSTSASQIEREDAEADAAGASALRGRGQVPVSDTSKPQAGSMVEMDVTGEKMATPWLTDA